MYRGSVKGYLAFCYEQNKRNLEKKYLRFCISEERIGKSKSIPNPYHKTYEEREQEINHAYKDGKEEIQKLRQSSSCSCQKERNLQRKGKSICCRRRSQAAQKEEVSFKNSPISVTLQKIVAVANA
jgi:hypothetical protein